jgi:hypothetical protein
VRGVDERLELIATVLLALATVGTAWSGYQASRWNGEQAKASARASAARIESAKAAGTANAQKQVDVATFTAWADAYAQDQQKLAAFYFARFRKEFRPAAQAWVATRPLQNPRAPLTPFVMPQYRLAAEARVDVQRSTNYVLAVVLFATVLFFAGMSTKLTVPALRRALLALGVVIFVGTLLWIATSPVNVSV